MKKRYFSYPENSLSSRPHESILEFCLPYFEKLGICYFHYFRYYKDNHIFQLMHDLSLDDYYWRTTDTCTLPADITSTPLNELNIMTWQDSSVGYMTTAIEKECGITDPIVIYIARDTHIEFYVLAAPAGSIDNFSRYLMNITEIRAMTTAFNQHFKSMLEQAHNERAPAPNVLEHQKFNFRPLTLTIKGELGVANLTAKEVEVLNLLVRGMSGKDIAQALNRSNRTIETHIASMRTKTGFKKSKLVTEALKQLYTIQIRSDKVGKSV